MKKACVITRTKIKKSEDDDHPDPKNTPTCYKDLKEGLFLES